MTLQKTSIIFYCLALVTPIFFGNLDIGLVALLMGWMGVLSMEVEFAFPWLANLIYFWTLYTPEKKKLRRIILNLITLFLASFALMIKEAPKIDGNEEVTVGVGFYIWMFSFVILLLHNLRIKGTTVTELKQNAS